MKLVRLLGALLLLLCAPVPLFAQDTLLRRTAQVALAGGAERIGVVG